VFINCGILDSSPFPIPHQSPAQFLQTEAESYSLSSFVQVKHLLVGIDSFAPSHLPLQFFTHDDLSHLTHYPQKGIY
jgi:hypothetical protein